MKRRAAVHSPPLQISDDGRIWWPVADAPKYAVPGRGGVAIANQRLLAAALADVPLDDGGPPPPHAAEREGVRCVDAAEYLSWVAQWIALTQVTIPSPDAASISVREALREYRNKSLSRPSLIEDAENAERAAQESILIEFGVGFCMATKDREYAAEKARTKSLQLAASEMGAQARKSMAAYLHVGAD